MTQTMLARRAGSGTAAATIATTRTTTGTAGATGAHRTPIRPLGKARPRASRAPACRRADPACEPVRSPRSDRRDRDRGGDRDRRDRGGDRGRDDRDDYDDRDFSRAVERRYPGFTQHEFSRVQGNTGRTNLDKVERILAQRIEAKRANDFPVADRLRDQARRIPPSPACRLPRRLARVLARRTPRRLPSAQHTKPPSTRACLAAYACSCAASWASR
jgi:hypothetical protein